MNYLQFDFEIESPGQSEKLVALLAEQGFEGFEEEEDSQIGRASCRERVWRYV